MCADSSLDCEQVHQDVELARSAIDDVRTRISDIQDARANDRDLTASEQRDLDDIQSLFGDEGTSDEGLSNLSDRLGDIHSELGDIGEGAIISGGSCSLGRACIRKNNGGNDYIALDEGYIGDPNSDDRASTLVHEGAHLVGIGSGFNELYGRQAIESNIRRGGTSRAQADAFACLVFETC
ncbi:hypothetical protein GCM10007148_28520 [Parvularcula lutaonensis]|nr:hypothetical protein GCM10007148_28520 [Parvularcula lutaonensis]